MRKVELENGRGTPAFGMLSVANCWAVLRRNHVGRLAFLNEGLVDLQPVTYAAGDGWLFIRSAEGTKLEALAHHPYVAFEVDEVRGPFEWRSVVARGTIYLMSDNGSYVDRADYARAVRALRAVMPLAFSTGDPVPFRRTVYGVHVDQISGRVATDRRDLAPTTPAPPPRISHRRRTPDGF